MSRESKFSLFRPGDQTEVEELKRGNPRKRDMTNPATIAVTIERPRPEDARITDIPPLGSDPRLN